MEQLIAKVEKQEVEIDYIKKSLEELVNQSRKQSEQLQKIGESIQKQEIILEKITNLENKYNDSIKRCHRRIDDELERCKNERKRLEKEFEAIKTDLMGKPCQNYDLINKDIEQLKRDLGSHSKIFWWITTLIVGAVIIAILKEHFH